MMMTTTLTTMITIVIVILTACNFVIVIFNGSIGCEKRELEDKMTIDWFNHVFFIKSETLRDINSTYCNLQRRELEMRCAEHS